MFSYRKRNEGGSLRVVARRKRARLFPTLSVGPPFSVGDCDRLENYRTDNEHGTPARLSRDLRQNTNFLCIELLGGCRVSGLGRARLCLLRFHREAGGRRGTDRCATYIFCISCFLIVPTSSNRSLINASYIPSRSFI